MFNAISKGVRLSRPISVVPTLNITVLIAVSSEAFAVTVTEPKIGIPAAGAVMVTVGATVSISEAALPPSGRYPFPQLRLPDQ